MTEAKYLYMWMKCMHARGARLVMALSWSSSSRRAHRCLRSLSSSKVGGGVGWGGWAGAGVGLELGAGGVVGGQGVIGGEGCFQCWGGVGGGVSEGVFCFGTSWLRWGELK